MSGCMAAGLHVFPPKERDYREEVCFLFFRRYATSPLHITPTAPTAPPAPRLCTSPPSSFHHTHAHITMHPPITPPSHHTHSPRAIPLVGSLQTSKCAKPNVCLAADLTSGSSNRRVGEPPLLLLLAAACGGPCIEYADMSCRATAATSSCNPPDKMS